MQHLFLALTVNVAIISLAIAALKFAGKVEVNPKWSLVSLALLASYVLAVVSGGHVIPVELVIPDPSWNWGGKILAIILLVAVLFATTRLKAGFTLADAGFVLKQKDGSTRPALIALGLFVLLQVLISLLDGGGAYDSEELWFQALMPGLDEEPMFRGLLLYFSSLAITSARTNVFGSPINVAGAALAVLFGLGHGVAFDGQEWHFSPFNILVTGLYGFFLLWFRERTGSLVFPILAHNIVNFAGRIVPALG